jgi:endonuclease/exonuclease/phosphatase family metal-dependent hydrolase
MVVAGLLFAPPAAVSQTALTKGTDQTFEAATWNIEWFGGPNGPTDDARQVRNVTRIIEEADIDLWALQEIADETAFNTLVADLGAAYEAHLAPTSAQQSLGLAFIYKPDVVRLRKIAEVLTPFASDFAGRPPWQLEADITVEGTTVTATFIVVHMKATSDIDSYNQRASASTRLKNHIDFTTLTSEPVIILGDLNDLLSGSITSGQPSPYKNFVDDPNYETPTLAMQLDGRNTYCRSSGCLSGSTIDHIILSNEAEPWYVMDSADHFDEVINEITSYVSTTSDHLPVLATFSLTSTGIDDDPVPLDANVTSAYPNPFRDRLTVEYSAGLSGSVRLTLADLLGRTVRDVSLQVGLRGVQREELDTSDLAPGLYILRIHDDTDRSFSRPLIRL